VRQLDRQIATQFYERTLLSRNKAAMLRKGEEPLPTDAVSPEQEIKDPFVLEFLNLKDEYSQSDLEEALISKLESFLLELGGDFAFVARQRRLRIGGEWYRIDLLFFHRRLRCLVVIDLKVSKFTHADAGQMHLYLTPVKTGRIPARTRRWVSSYAPRKIRPWPTTLWKACPTRCWPPNTNLPCPIPKSLPMSWREHARCSNRAGYPREQDTDD
jgi:predicted nuclease of restriction endonuclease-like (RecB) superfamily